MKFDEASIIAHSLGINLLHAKMSKKVSDRRLPNEFKRNRFCTSEGHSDLDKVLSLQKAGLMRKGGTINQGTATMWYVTSKGEERFREEFPNLISKGGAAQKTSDNGQTKE
jgi:hypothetical protein